MNIRTYEHQNATEIVDKQILSDVLKILENTEIELPKLKSTDIKNKVEEKFRENGWSTRVSVDPILKHFISGIYKDIGLVVQFGNMAMCYADMLKLELLHKRRMINSAFYIILTKKDKRARKENYAQFEKLSKHLKLYSDVVEVPIIVMGIEGDKNEIGF